MEKLLIVDGHNLLFRMYYGIPSPIRNSKGEDIRGVVGFVGGLLKVIRNDSYEKLIIVFDTETSISARLEEDENYKQNRIDYSQVPDDENPFTQLPYIFEALNHLEIYYHEAFGYEADDYIASLCKLYKQTHDITIVSTDRDFLQLIDENITVYSPRGKQSIRFTPNILREKFELDAKQMIDYKVLVGDKSDNILGVRSIGPKTALKILKNGTLDEILNGDKFLDEKWFHLLHENRDIISKNKYLITMKQDIEINADTINCMINFSHDLKVMEILKSCRIV